MAGIDRYDNDGIDSLHNAVNDAKSVAKMLKKLGFEVTELYNENATKKKILKAIKAIKRKNRVQNSGVLVFYFCGAHGQGHKRLALTREKKEGIYKFPYDANISLRDSGVITYDEEAISLSRLRAYVSDMRAKHVALLLDSCFSGLVMKRTKPKLPVMTRDYYADLLKRKAIDILTAGADQPVSDGTGHSPVTRALLDAP